MYPFQRILPALTSALFALLERSTKRLALLLVCVLALSSGTSLLAQNSERAATSSATGSVFPSWDAAAHYLDFRKFIVVLVSQPRVRHTCSVQSITDTELICKGKFNTIQRYRGDDIEAVIVPGKHGNRWAFVLGFQGSGVGAIVVACKLLAVATAGPIALLVVGAVLILMGITAYIGDNDGSTPDTVYYLRSGSELKAY